MKQLKVFQKLQFLKVRQKTKQDRDVALDMTFVNTLHWAQFKDQNLPPTGGYNVG